MKFNICKYRSIKLFSIYKNKNPFNLKYDDTLSIYFFNWCLEIKY